MKLVPHQTLPRQKLNNGDKIPWVRQSSHRQSINHQTSPSSLLNSEGMDKQGKKGRDGKGGEWDGWEWVFVGVTVSEWGAGVGLLLIQYISCQIQPPVFFIALLFSLILHALLATVTATLRAPLQPSRQQSDPPLIFNQKIAAMECSEQGIIKTVPKINELQQLRANAKTRKLRLGLGKQEEGGSDELQSVKKKLLMVLKMVQTLFQLVVPSVQLALFYPTSSYGQTQLALSFLEYLLVPASLFTFCLLLRHIRPVLHPHPHPQTPLAHSPQVSQFHPMTRISIENMILHPKSSEIHSVTLEKDHHSPPKHGKSEPDRKTTSSMQREELKKPVLKPSKTQGLRSRKPSELQVGERRKVEFNSKKLECFEYLEITPPHSTAQEEATSKKLPQKPKGGAVRLKQLRHRLENQAQILRNKAMQREARSKSLGEVGRKCSEEGTHYNEDQFC